jgi:hypothetical protein
MTDTYFYYDKNKNKFIGCSYGEYIEVDPECQLDNFDKVKHDEFILAYEWGLPMDELCSTYVISTVSLFNPQDSISHSIFITLISSSERDYNGYQKRYASLKEAKEGHDEILLKILRGEELIGGK